VSGKLDSDEKAVQVREVVAAPGDFPHSAGPSAKSWPRITWSKLLVSEVRGVRGDHPAE
jgi:hypothetical protein